MEEIFTSSSPEVQVETYNPTQEARFKWTVNNYSIIPYESDERSPNFSVEQQSTWYATLTKYKGYINFCLNRNCDVFPVRVIYRFIIADCDGKEFYADQRNYDCNKKDFSYDVAQPPASWAATINLMNKAKKDIIVFTVFVKVALPSVTKIVKNTLNGESSQQKLLKALSDDLIKLLDDRTNTDVVLKVQDQEISVHKAILSARSTVFAKMFQHDVMNETKCNIVTIDDVTMSVLTALIRFLYSGQVKDYDFKTALELYYAADKYAVLELREICACALVSKMTLNDILKVLTLADLHQDVGLKDKVIQFIKTH